MNQFIEVMTGGDFTRLLTFIISFTFISLLGLAIFYSLKKMGIHVKVENGKISLGMKGHEHPPPSQQITETPPNGNVDNQGMISNVQTFVKPDGSTPFTLEELGKFLRENGYTPATNSTMIDGLKMIEKDTSHTEKYLSDISQQSKDSWENLKITRLKNELEEKRQRIASLEKTNTILKKQVNQLNKELIEYKCYDDPILVEFRNIKNLLKDDYINFIKKTVLDKKLKDIDINNRSELKNYCRNFLNLLMISVGSRLIQNLHVDLWRDEKTFAYEIIKENGQEFFINFVEMIKVLLTIDINSQKKLDEKREIIDKKILSTFSGITKSHWNEMFSPKNKESIERIKKARNSFEYYKNECWNFDEIHELFYQIGTDMIIVYEQIKSSSLDKQILTSLSYFDSITYVVDAKLKDFVIKKHKDYLDKTKNKEKDNIQTYVKSMFQSD